MSSAQLIDGKGIAAQLLKQVGEQVQRLVAQGRQPALAVVLVGDDPASQVYVRHKVLKKDKRGQIYLLCICCVQPLAYLVRAALFATLRFIQLHLQNDSFRSVTRAEKINLCAPVQTGKR